MRAREAVRRVVTGLLPTWRMRTDWDARGRQNAPCYINCAHAETDAAFWASGVRDLEDVVLQDIEVLPEAHALEIGCGMGRLLRPLSRRVLRVVGVDISAEMIARARQALEDCSNIELAVTRGHLDEIPDASLDLVYSYIVFQHIPVRRAIRRYIREAARVLRDGGIFRFQVDGRSGGYRLASTWLGARYEAQELRRYLPRNDLQIVDLWGEGTQYLWITAQRNPRSNSSRTAAVRVIERVWNQEAVRQYLQACGHDASRQLQRVLAGEHSLRQLGVPFLVASRQLEPEEFVSQAYKLCLGRPADPEGLAFYVGELRSGVPRNYTLDCLLAYWEARARFRRHVA